MKNFIIIFMLMLSSIVFADGIALEGTLILKDNTTIPIEGFTEYNDINDYILYCRYNNTDLEIQLKKIKRIDVLSGSLTTYSERKNKVRIELQDGKIYDVLDIALSFSYNKRGSLLFYRTYDSINEIIVTNRIDLNQVSNIILEKIGDVSVDPSTGQKFPPDFRYNPYTGNKLEPGNFGEWEIGKRII